ncbi:MAG: hypothetical protein ACFFDF_05815, partial [Candidatus Odinarchaeota archaeon]
KDLKKNNKIKKFLIGNPLNLNETWLTAASYLSIIDILIIQKRIEFGLVKQDKNELNLSYDQKFDGLINEMKSRGIKIDSKMLGFQKMLRDFRTQVIHYGYCPNQKELDLIVEYSEKTISEILKVKIIKNS